MEHVDLAHPHAVGEITGIDNMNQRSISMPAPCLGSMALLPRALARSVVVTGSAVQLHY